MSKAQALKRIECNGTPFVLLDGRRHWTEQPPAVVLPDLIDDASARAYCQALDRHES